VMLLQGDWRAQNFRGDDRLQKTIPVLEHPLQKVRLRLCRRGRSRRWRRRSRRRCGWRRGRSNANRRRRCRRQRALRRRRGRRRLRVLLVAKRFKRR
jgi:hypothetical protein